MVYKILAHWDREARVWWAESSDVPGIVGEAATLDALVADLRVIVPEMLADNQGQTYGDKIEFEVIADSRTEAVQIAA
jgi:predicted RNase H-like HicB family nuclease